MLSGPVQVVSQGLFDESADQLHRLGETVFANDGRVYRYAQAGGSALVAGQVQQAPAQDTGDADLAVAAAAVGDASITTTDTVTVTANQYAEGFLVVTKTAGQGLSYQIDGHAAATGAVVTINLVDEVQVALTASSEIDLVKNPHDGVIVAPTTPTSSVVGVSVTALTASEFGWLQVAGPAAVEAEGALTVGLDVVSSDADAGCVEVIADGAAELLPRVGKALTTVADGEWGLIKLELL